jgi:hypothetical protein
MIEPRKADGRRPVAAPVIWGGREVVGMTLDGELVGVLTDVPIDAGMGVVEDETVEEAVLEDVVVAGEVVTAVVLVLV